MRNARFFSVCRISAAARRSAGFLMLLFLVMTVFPGFGGQAFIADALGKAAEASRIWSELALSFVIEVDGGVTPANAGLVREAGAQIIVAGTAIFGSADYAASIAAIRA